MSETPGPRESATGAASPGTPSSGAAAPSDEPQPKDGFLTRERLEKARDRLFEAMVGALLTIVTGTAVWIIRPFTEQKWQVLLFLVPITVFAAIFWRKVTRRNALLVRGWPLASLILYLCVFSWAASERKLDWKHDARTLRAAQEPRRWVAPARWGDWHYMFAPRDEPARDPVVITVKPPTTVEEGRFRVAQLIGVAAAAEARGIAFDFGFAGGASGADDFLCSTVSSARIPVIAGVRVVVGASDTAAFYGEAYPGAIERCWSHDRRGHLHGYRDADGTVRHVVLRIDIPDSASLSLRVAREMTGKTDLARDDTLMQFLEPKPPVQPVSWDRLAAMEPRDLNGLIKGRFLLVGEDSPEETFRTPFGLRLGVQVHAAAVENLITGRWIERQPWWWSLLIIVAACYYLTLLAAEGVPGRRLGMMVLAGSVGLIVVAGVVMRVWRVWLDLVYPLVAVWLLLLILLSLRRLRRATPAKPSAAGKAA